MGYEVSVDADMCIASGTCVATHAYFVFDDDGIASVDPNADAPSDDELIDIARNCPSGAIKLRDDGVNIDV